MTEREESVLAVRRHLQASLWIPACAGMTAKVGAIHSEAGPISGIVAS
jgi:hypothetical protein